MRRSVRGAIHRSVDARPARSGCRSEQPRYALRIGVAGAAGGPDSLQEKAVADSRVVGCLVHRLQAHVIDRNTEQTTDFRIQYEIPNPNMHAIRNSTSATSPLTMTTAWRVVFDRTEMAPRRTKSGADHSTSSFSNSLRQR